MVASPGALAAETPRCSRQRAQERSPRRAVLAGADAQGWGGGRRAEGGGLGAGAGAGRWVPAWGGVLGVEAWGWDWEGAGPGRVCDGVKAGVGAETAGSTSSRWAVWRPPISVRVLPVLPPVRAVKLPAVYPTDGAEWGQGPGRQGERRGARARGPRGPRRAG